MQAEGKSDQDITLIMQQQGYSIKDISDSLAQARIRRAVTAPDPPDSGQDPSYALQQGQEMQQSMITEAPTVQEMQAPEPNQAPQQEYADQNQQYAQQDYPQQYGQAQQQYEQYDSYNSNTDTVTDIAEQVVAEKLASIRKQLETAIALKTTMEAKILAIDDRLKRMEKIIDRLQLSILQKVGEYVTNVDDIKKEMIETQKSFKALLNTKPNKGVD